METDCPFCRIPQHRIIAQNDKAFAIFDAYPVTRNHALIIPRRHFADLFEMTAPEIEDVLRLLQEMRQRLIEEDLSICGFNVGANTGQAAGQTIPHCHIHLIPRRRGDIDDPTGGVRGVIPARRIY